MSEPPEVYSFNCLAEFFPATKLFFQVGKINVDKRVQNLWKV